MLKGYYEIIVILKKGSTGSDVTANPRVGGMWWCAAQGKTLVTGSLASWRNEKGGHI